MLRFNEFAEHLRALRMKTVKDPSAGGFTRSGNVYVRVMEMELHYEVGEKIIPAGIVSVFYVDTDANARTPEAQLIRAGLWESYECGWLIANIKGTAVTLAKVTPAERNDLDQGWITDSLQLVLRRE